MAIMKRSRLQAFLLRHNASVELKVKFLGLLRNSHKQSIEVHWALKDVSLQIGKAKPSDSSAATDREKHTPQGDCRHSS